MGRTAMAPSVAVQHGLPAAIIMRDFFAAADRRSRLPRRVPSMNFQ